jgi:hypothetical protein
MRRVLTTALFLKRVLLKRADSPHSPFQQIPANFVVAPFEKGAVGAVAINEKMPQDVMIF